MSEILKNLLLDDFHAFENGLLVHGQEVVVTLGQGFA